MLPALQEFDKGTNGIYRVIEAYHKYLPKYGVEFVDSNNYDLLASHAGRVEKCDIAHVHGLYWTGDYKASRAEFTTNKKVIENSLYAKEITVPSDWVAQTFARDLRVYPHVIPHGIDIEQWKYPNENLGYILWNKNIGVEFYRIIHSFSCRIFNIGGRGSGMPYFIHPCNVTNFMMP